MCFFSSTVVVAHAQWRASCTQNESAWGTTNVTNVRLDEPFVIETLMQQ